MGASRLARDSTEPGLGNGGPEVRGAWLAASPHTTGSLAVRMVKKRAATGRNGPLGPAPLLALEQEFEDFGKDVHVGELETADHLGLELFHVPPVL